MGSAWVAGVVALIALLAWIVGRRWWGTAGLLLAVVHAVTFAHHVDDAGIDYAFARNLAQGQGLVAQPGGAMVEGFSNPLWVALLTLAEGAGMSAEFASSILQFLAMMLAVMVGSGLAREAGASREGAAEVATLVVMSGVVAAWTTAGLEGALLALGLVTVAWLAATGRAPLTLGAVAVVTWIRPEAAASGVLAAAGGLALAGRWRQLGWPVAGALVGLAVQHGLRFAFLETVWPTSVVAKTGGAPWRTVAAGGLYAAVSATLAGLPWLIVGWWPRRRQTAAWLPAGIVAGGALVLAVASGGDWMRHGRFLAPYLPLILALAVPRLATDRWGRIARWGLALTGAAVLFDALWRPTVPMSHGDHRGALYGVLAADICGKTSVATPDIGGVLWHHPRIVVTDLVGLIDAEAAGNRRDRDYWPHRLGGERPALVDLHHGWARRTGLDDETLLRIEYRILARRPAEDPASAPTLWVDARCDGTMSFSARRALLRWVADGSGPT